MNFRRGWDLNPSRHKDDKLSSIHIPIMVFFGDARPFFFKKKGFASRLARWSELRHPGMCVYFLFSYVFRVGGSE